MAGSRVAEIVDATVDALKGDTTLVTLLGGDKVYTHAPQKTPAPYALVLGGDEVPWVVDFGEDNGARQVEVLVQLTSTYKGQSEVNDLASRTIEVLTDEAVWPLDGLRLVEFVKNSAQPPIDLMSDGVIWYVRFVTVRVSLEAV